MVGLTFNAGECSGGGHGCARLVMDADGDGHGWARMGMDVGRWWTWMDSDG